MTSIKNKSAKFSKMSILSTDSKLAGKNLISSPLYQLVLESMFDFMRDMEIPRQDLLTHWEAGKQEKSRRVLVCYLSAQEKFKETAEVYGLSDIVKILDNETEPSDPQGDLNTYLSFYLDSLSYLERQAKRSIRNQIEYFSYCAIISVNFRGMLQLMENEDNRHELMPIHHAIDALNDSVKIFFT